MSGETFLEKQEENISIHIFSVSAAMVGVCLTVIGLLNIVTYLKKIEIVGDDLTAVGAIMFLSCCIVSYSALRTKFRRRRYVLEKIADFLFLSALLLMVLVCILIVHKLF